MDLTPTWREAMPLYIRWLQQGDDKQRKLATEQLLGLAKQLDEANSGSKATPELVAV